jgi:hypothetical protein
VPTLEHACIYFMAHIYTSCASKILFIIVLKNIITFTVRLLASNTHKVHLKSPYAFYTPTPTHPRYADYKSVIFLRLPNRCILSTITETKTTSLHILTYPHAMTLRSYASASDEMVLYYAVITGMWYSTKGVEEYFVSTFILLYLTA